MHRAVRISSFVRLAVCAAIIASTHPYSTAHAAWPVDPSTNLVIADASGEQSSPSVTSDGAGGMIIVWEDFRGGAESDVYAQRVDASGTAMWGANGLAICTVGQYQTRPRVASDGTGGAIFSWADYRSGSGDIYVQRVSGTGQVLWAPTGFPICDNGEAQLGVSMCSDGAGGAIIVWEDFRADAAGDLYAQRINGSGIPYWTINGVPVTVASGGQLAQRLVMDGGGGAIVVWQDLRTGWAGDVYAQRLNASGVARWATNGVALCTAVGGQYDPQLTAHASGGAIVTWSDERTGTADIFAQRISAAGSTEWTADGVLVCGAGSFQTFPVIATDGVSGVLIAWEDARSDTTVDIYAQRVSSDGMMEWATDGIPVCVESGWKSQPAMVADHSGGAVVTWQDQRSLEAPAARSLRGVRTRDQWLALRNSGTAAPQGDFVPGDDVYAQRITSEGQKGWPAAGVPVCFASDAQVSPVVVPDGSGGALVTWYDMRNGDWDIYAQHVTNAGTLGGTVDVPAALPTSHVQLSTPYPNPARHGTTIRLSLSEFMKAELDVFDTVGRRVRRLHTGELTSGSHSVHFDLRNSAGQPIGAGLYFVRLRTPQGQRTARLAVTQ